MAQNIVKDSANWASLWVKEVNLGSTEANLPGGSAAAANGKLARVGNKVGVIVDDPILRSDGNYWATIDTACLVRLSGVSGTATDGATVYITGTNASVAATLTASTNSPIGYLDRAKAATGDDLWLQLVPGATLPVTAS